MLTSCVYIKQAQACHRDHAKLMQAFGHVLLIKLMPQVVTDQLVVATDALLAVLFKVRADLLQQCRSCESRPA